MNTLSGSMGSTAKHRVRYTASRRKGKLGSFVSDFLAVCTAGNNLAPQPMCHWQLSVDAEKLEN